MRGATLTKAALAAVFIAASARAEVRLVEDTGGSLVVDIRTTPTGPWTPTGSVTEFVLNPSGDLFGDGMPGWDTRVSSVLSAWVRPGEGTLYRSLGRDDGWLPLADIATPGAIGQPVVDVLTGGWSVAWQQAVSTYRAVYVTGTLPDGRAVAPVAVAGGALIGTAPNGNLLHVITMIPSTGAIWCTTVSFAFVPTQPIPITISVIGRVQLGNGGQLGLGDQPSQNGAPKSGSMSLGDPKVHDSIDRMGDMNSIVTWWSGSDLKWVEIGKDGVQMPPSTVTGRGGAKDPQKMVDSALRQAAQD